MKMFTMFLIGGSLAVVATVAVIAGGLQQLNLKGKTHRTLGE